MSSLTAHEVAADLHLGCTESVLRLLRAGDLPGFKVGRRWRVDSGALAAWKASKAVHPHAGGAGRPADPNRIAPRSTRSQAALGRRRNTSTTTTSN